MAIGAVIDDEVELRPILRGLADVGDVNEAAQIGEPPFDPGANSPL